MKKKIAFAFGLCLIALIAWAVDITDIAGRTVRYRKVSTLTFDSTSSIKDEDAAWTITASQMGKLAVLQYGTSANGNNKSVTNTFTTAFTSTPIVTIAAGTNDLPHLITVTTTNVIFGAAQTNASIRWIAIGSP